MQIRVREKFALLRDMDVHQGTVPWIMIDAAQPQENVQSDIWEAVQQTIQECADQPIKAMWQQGIYDK